MNIITDIKCFCCEKLLISLRGILQRNVIWNNLGRYRCPSLNNVISTSVIRLYKFARRVTAGTWLRDNIRSNHMHGIARKCDYPRFFRDPIHHMLCKHRVRAIRSIRETRGLEKGTLVRLIDIRVSRALSSAEIRLCYSFSQRDWVNDRLISYSWFWALWNFFIPRRPKTRVTIN